MWVTVQWRCSILQLFMPPKSFLVTRLTWSLSYLERRKCEIWQAIVPSFVLQIASHTPPHMSVPVSVYQQLLFLSPPIRNPPLSPPPLTRRYPPLFADSPKSCVLSPASTVRRRWPQSRGAKPPPPALPLKDNAVYCICQASAAILCKSIAHLLPCTLSRYWCASFVWFCLCYLANWLMAEGWRQTSKNFNMLHSAALCPILPLFQLVSFFLILTNISHLPIYPPLPPFFIQIAKDQTRTDDSK